MIDFAEHSLSEASSFKGLPWGGLAEAGRSAALKWQSAYANAVLVVPGVTQVPFLVKIGSSFVTFL